MPPFEGWAALPALPGGLKPTLPWQINYGNLETS